MYTIGRLARVAKVNPDSIRFYERQGLLSPANKTDSGYRLYTDAAVRRIAFIKRAQQCGFSLAEIRDLLQMHSDDAAARTNAYSLAEKKQAQIERTLVALQAMAKALSCLLESRSQQGRRDPRELEEDVVVTALDTKSHHAVSHTASSAPDYRVGSGDYAAA
jgi:MerR family Zn(II)-responsive transcriptional regulator of zntA